MKSKLHLIKKFRVPLLVVSLLLNIILGAVIVSQKFVATSEKVTKASPSPQNKTQDNLFDKINPAKGFEINASYGNLGPKMVTLGVIDPEKFKSTYEKSNQPLTPEQEDILLKGSDDKIKITRDNSYFLLNFFWAVGLANKSKILDDGEMIKYGGIEGAGNFASTGGWTLSKGNSMNYYSKSYLIPMTKEQEELVDLVASNIYRPCCNNSTAFPDCNHGMALLGVLQLMSVNGANQKDLYNAAKYFNAFWFPGNYYDIAMYFKNSKNEDFEKLDPKILLSKDYSSASGWQGVKKWLSEKGLIEQPPKQGGGCGV